MRELIITFSLVLKIIVKWERLPHRLKELKRRSKVLELFPNRCNSHIPPEAAVSDLRWRCGRDGGGISFPRRFSPPGDSKVAPGVALTGNWGLA